MGFIDCDYFCAWLVVTAVPMRKRVSRVFLYSCLERFGLCMTSFSKRDLASTSTVSKLYPSLTAAAGCSAMDPDEEAIFDVGGPYEPLWGHQLEEVSVFRL